MMYFICSCVFLFVYGGTINTPREDLKINSVDLAGGFDFLNPLDEKETIFEFNYEKGHKYVFPDYPKIEFLVPDEETIKTRASSIKQSNLGWSDSYSKIIGSLLAKYHIHEEGKISNSSYGNGTIYIKWLKEKMGKENKSCGMSEIYYSHYTATTDPYMFMTLTDDFTAMLEGLPAEIKTKDDKKKVYEFIYKYGTHFYEDGVYGGSVELLVCVNNTLIRKKPLPWIQTQMRALYYLRLFDLDHGPYQNKSEIHVEKEFLNNTDSLLVFQGGEKKYWTDDTLKEWSNGLDLHSGQINSTLTMMSELIDDSKKSKTVADTIIEYIKKGPLKRLTWWD